MKIRYRTMALVVITLSLLGLTVGPSRADDTAPTPTLVDAVPGLAGLALPDVITRQLGGLPHGELRDYGTPTAAPGKVCPFVGDVPVSLPAVTSPVGTSIPGMAGLNLAKPDVPATVYAELCMSKSTLAEARAGRPPAVLVLVHGITYGTWYWDLPYQPQRYSTVNYLNEHGYATLNIDRVGDGRSSHPASPLVNAPAQAEVVHQLIGKLRDGKIGDVQFRHVGLVGHSYGTVINWIESAIYNDADVNIGTGYSDRVDPVNAGSFIALGTPAALSEVQAKQPWAIDPGYLQPLPTARDLPQLYFAPNRDPGVVATDVRLANTVTVGEIATFVPREYDGTHKNITIPTFSVQGEFDIMTCGQDAQECATDATPSDNPVEVERKSARYTAWQSTAMNSRSCFRGAVIPDAAHNVALHKNATQFDAQVAFFADQAMGVEGQNVDRYRKTCATHGPSIFDTLPELTRLVPPFPIGLPPLQPTADAVLSMLYPR